MTDIARSILPWSVNEIHATSNWLHVRGFNYYTDQSFSWSIDVWSFTKPSFVAERYDFRGASISEAGRDRLRALVSKWTEDERAAVAGLVEQIADAQAGAA